jgi:hypothetical protein
MAKQIEAPQGEVNDGAEKSLIYMDISSFRAFLLHPTILLAGVDNALGDGPRTLVRKSRLCH